MNIQKKRRHLLLLLVLSFWILGFSTARIEAYVVTFDSKRAEPTKVFEAIEDFIQTQGFAIERKLEESYPENRIVTQLNRGAVGLTLILQNSSAISLQGFQWRPGCTTIQEIAYLKELQMALRDRVRERLGVDIDFRQAEPSKL